MSDAKADILARVREALGPSPSALAIPRAYRAPGSAPRDAAVVERFCERVAEYRATVHRSSDVAAAVRAILGEGVRVGVPPGLPDRGLAVIEDDGLSVAKHDTLNAVVTGSAFAIATPARSSSTPARRPGAARSRSSPTTISASSTRPRSSRRSPTRSPRSPHHAPSPSSPAPPQPPTSSSTASKASTPAHPRRHRRHGPLTRGAAGAVPAAP